MGDMIFKKRIKTQNDEIIKRNTVKNHPILVLLDVMLEVRGYGGTMVWQPYVCIDRHCVPNSVCRIHNAQNGMCTTTNRFVKMLKRRGENRTMKICTWY